MPLSCKDIGIKKSEIVAKTQFLSHRITVHFKTSEEQTAIHSPDEEKSVLVNSYRLLCKLSR